MNPTKSCVTIGKTAHGKWTYLTVVIYVEGILKTGEKVWKKDRIVWKATTQAKIERLAKQVAKEQDIPFILNVRHNDRIIENS